MHVLGGQLSTSFSMKARSPSSILSVVLVHLYKEMGRLTRQRPIDPKPNVKVNSQAPVLIQQNAKDPPPFSTQRSKQLV
jgi:hypothetical protein